VKNILVVGAGFAGVTYARQLAEAGFRVDIIDKRPHIAGNAFDRTDGNGVRVHVYGPHLFHTSNERVVKWIGQFGEFIPYHHRVTAFVAKLREYVPIPINRVTINKVFGLALSNGSEVAAFLSRIAEPIATIHNAADHLNAHIGRELTDLFFRPYTKKMWALDLEDLDAAVVKRIPIRHDDEDRYFPSDTFQILPKCGYTEIIRAVLDHPNIRTTLSVPFERAFLLDYDWCFNSMPIDEYYEYVFGRLPYRSIRFHRRTEPVAYQFGATSVVNFTDNSDFTRQTDWSLFPEHVARQSATKTITLEEPCDYADNQFERYYPVKTSDHRYDAVYRKFKNMAAEADKVHFIGRCGTYQYLDMHQVINQSLQGSVEWISKHW
jgi:UDP-galactopyranose mutase